MTLQGLLLACINFAVGLNSCIDQAAGGLSWSEDREEAGNLNLVGGKILNWRELFEGERARRDLLGRVRLSQEEELIRFLGEHPWSDHLVKGFKEKDEIKKLLKPAERTRFAKPTQADQGAQVEELALLKDDIASCKICPRQILENSPGPLPLGEGETGVKVLFVSGLAQRNREGNVVLLREDSLELFLKMARATGLGPEDYRLSSAARCLLRESLEWERDEELISNCRAHLFREIQIFHPLLIVPLGALATAVLLGRREKLSACHGKFFEFQSEDGKRFPFMPLFHPDFLLGNPHMKKASWLDLQKVIAFFAERGKMKH